jgi:hypothetical protein
MSVYGDENPCPVREDDNLNPKNFYEVGELIDIIKNNLPFPVTIEYKGRTQGDQFGIFCSYEKIYNALG